MNVVVVVRQSRGKGLRSRAAKRLKRELSRAESRARAVVFEGGGRW